MNRKEYLLTSLGEEASEIAHRVSKSLRFGLQESYQGQTNERMLIGEVNDLMAILKMLDDEGFLNVKDSDFGREEPFEAKRIKVEKYYQYAIACGTVTETKPLNSMAAAMVRASQD